MTSEELIQFILTLEGVTQKKHFEREAFSAKRIFATISLKEMTLNVKLTPNEQKIFCQVKYACVQKIANKWGEQGWTTIYYNQAENSLLREIIYSAYETGK